MGAQISHPIFARVFDRFAGKDKGRGEAELRDELLGGLKGRVMEVGPGNGINFEHFPATVEKLVAAEPEPYLRRAAARAAGRVDLDVEVMAGLADELPAEDGSVDAVVVAGVLCTVPDVAAALREFERVLKPGGELRFYEHVRSRRARFACFQDAADRVWPRLMGGCHVNRDTLAAIEASGFRVERLRGFAYPPGARLPPVLPRILGVARLP